MNPTPVAVAEGVLVGVVCVPAVAVGVLVGVPRSGVSVTVWVGVAVGVAPEVAGMRKTETLVPGNGYIGIVPTASVWPIPQD